MDAKRIRNVVEPVFRRHDNVVLAYLFGSTARGDTHARSDLDFAVLLRDPSLDPYRSLWSDLHDVLSPRPFDLATLNGADPVLCFDVISEGQPLFFRSADELNDFERRVWHRYQDTRRLRAIGDLYLRRRAEKWSSRKSPSASVSSDSQK